MDGEQEWDSISAQIDEYCKTEGFLSWFKTSAKDNIGVCFIIFFNLCNYFRLMQQDRLWYKRL